MSSKNIYTNEILNITTTTKYTKWYLSIIEASLNRVNTRVDAKKLLGYTESHHILPVCLCEDETQETDKFNLAFLTAREHFICHWLLTKMFKCNVKILFAFSMMSIINQHQDSRKINSKNFDKSRQAFSLASSITHKNTRCVYDEILQKFIKIKTQDFDKNRHSHPNKFMSEEAIKKMGENISKGKTGAKRKPFTYKNKKIMSETFKENLSSYYKNNPQDSEVWSNRGKKVCLTL